MSELVATPGTTAHQASLFITTMLKLMSTESVMPSNHLILCRPLSSCTQFSAASGSFPTSQFFTSDGQSYGVSASASVLPMNTQDWSPLDGLVGSPCSPRGLSRVFSNSTIHKHQFSSSQLSLVQLTSIHATEKIITLARWTVVGQVMSLLFNMLSRLDIAFLQGESCGHHLQWFWRPEK